MSSPGRSLLLAASVPSQERNPRYLQVEDAHAHVEEAMVSLGRAVFAARMRLVFGGHPSISGMLPMVASEYLSARDAETSGRIAPVSDEEASERHESPTLIYQSRAFEAHVPPATHMLARMGAATLCWVDAVDGERFDPERPMPQCHRSLAKMRRSMFTDSEPAGLVVIGGMEGVEEEAALFHELHPHAPLYAIASTGGAASLIANGDADLPRSARNRVRVPDRELERQLSGDDTRWDDLLWTRSAAGRAIRPVPSYPLMMQLVVADLMKQRHRPRNGPMNFEEMD